MNSFKTNTAARAALAVSIVALVFSVAGGAYAVKLKLKANSVKTKAIKDGAVTTSKLAGNAVNAAAFGTILEYAEPLVVPADATAGDGVSSLGTATASCPSGQKVISGGGRSLGGAGANVSLTTSIKNGNGWSASFSSDVGNAAPLEGGYTYVYCLAP